MTYHMSMHYRLGTGITICVRYTLCTCYISNPSSYIPFYPLATISSIILSYHRYPRISPLCTIHIVCCTFFYLGSLYDFHSCVSTQGLNERCTARPLRESVFCVPTSLSFFLYPFPLSYLSFSLYPIV